MNKLNYEGILTIIKCRNGKELERHVQKNTVTEGLRAFLAGCKMNPPSNFTYHNVLGAVITVGKGSQAPSSSDKGVSTPCSFSSASNDLEIILANGNTVLGNVTQGSGTPDATATVSYCKETNVEVISDTSIHYRFKFIVPAMARFVDTVSEVSLFAMYGDRDFFSVANFYVCLTHALLKDAEGQPYTLQKTALDELTIYYDLTISSQNAGIVLCKNAFRYYGDRILDVSGETVTTSLHVIGAHYHNGATYFCVSEKDYNLDVTAYNSEANTTTGYIATIPTARVLRDRYTKRYIMRMLFGHNKCVELRYPNNTFGTPEITDIPVGIGDGATVDFTTPISFFVHNSDVVYKNGTALTRGVDYTIDNFNNADELPELYPSSHMLIVSHNDASGGFTHLFTFDKTLKNKRFDEGSGDSVGSLRCKYIANGTDTNAYTQPNMHLDEWILLYMPVDSSEFRWDIDTIYLYQRYTGTTVDLEYSADGVSFTNVLNGVDPHHSGATDNDPRNKTKEEGWTQFTIPNTRALYWRIRFHATGSFTNPGLIMCHSASKVIHFSTAPEANAELTMKARVDRPYMDGNHVLDAGVSIQF